MTALMNAVCGRLTVMMVATFTTILYTAQQIVFNNFG
jgi:hypothetical protein